MEAEISGNGGAEMEVQKGGVGGAEMEVQKGGVHSDTSYSYRRQANMQ